VPISSGDRVGAAQRCAAAEASRTAISGARGARLDHEEGRQQAQRAGDQQQRFPSTPSRR